MTIEICSTCVVVAVIDLTQREPLVLMLKRSPNSTFAGFWALVSGAVEPSETAWQAAWRELAEETGLQPNRLYSANICQQFYVIAENRIEVAPVFVAYLDTPQPVILNDEHDDFRWLPASTAAEQANFPGQRHFLYYLDAEFIQRSPGDFLRIPERH